MTELHFAPALFERLARDSAASPGVTRPSYGAGEQHAHDLVAEAAASLGMEKRVDAAGNMLLTLPGADRSRVLLLGSHVDTVPHGGNYDGLAGVLAGLEVAAGFVRGGRTPAVDIGVVALRAEESVWFPVSYIGSKTALGILPQEALAARRFDSGMTLGEHIREAGFDPEGVARGEKLIDPARIAGFVELHIEQGPHLISEGIVLGVVDGIRGSIRYREARCLGAYAHSGAVPRKWRHDAVVASAELVTRLDALWVELEEQGHDLTLTVGQLYTDAEQHAFAKVAGECRICIDVRSRSTDTLALVDERLKALCEEIAAARRVRFELGPRTGSTPAPMDERMQARLAEAAEALGVSWRRMSSGAGHDAATFALAGVPSVMLFVRNENGSHNPDEHMEMDDFAKAVAVMRRMASDFA
ncbi:Zn-dependent hydrolase [Marinimicrococcus flavescens]|uniref:Zn-dependent hydrolase n=1 Tax=Marinimicrococcus flavescens TaxID=3031815 RepID=A0AAP3UYP6_9PROT|nr:Zn-dependent hydrolase [Marinimicrococcus flavescens]